MPECTRVWASCQGYERSGQGIAGPSYWRPPRLPPRQGDSCKRSAHSGTVVVHVPLPRVRRAIIHEGRMEAVGRGVVEQEGNGIASYGAAAGRTGERERISRPCALPRHTNPRSRTQDNPQTRQEPLRICRTQEQAVPSCGGNVDRPRTIGEIQQGLLPVPQAKPARLIAREQIGRAHV